MINARNMGDGFVLALVLIILAATFISVNNKIIGVRKSFVTMKGKGFRSSPMKLGKLRPVFIAALIILILCLIVFPIVMLSLSTLMLLPDDYSLSNFTSHFWFGDSNSEIASGERGVFKNNGIIGGMFNSIKLGIFAAVVNAFWGF